jgi:molybdenum cofactor biosynthesis protein A
MSVKPKSILVDQFGRVHDYLRIALTERCNLRCFYCMPEEGIPLKEKSLFMTHEELISIASSFVELGVKKIRLTGGEPLVRKDAANILRELSKLPIDLGITTNGVLIDKFIDVFKECNIKNINVSLDSLDEVKQPLITKRNYYQRIINNIKLLLQNDMNVKINVVLMRGVNDDEISDFIDLTKEWNADVRFIEFMPFSGNNWEHEKCVSHNEVLERVKEHYGDENVYALSQKPNETAVNYKINGFSGKFGLISTVSNPFCQDCNRIRLTADGKMKNCLFSQGESDLLTAFRAKKDLKTIIESNILAKKEVRGGMKTQEEFSSPSKNRSMVLIGG